MLVRLLYVSRAVDESPQAIENILAQCRQYNPVSGITGILCYGGNVFLQASGMRMHKRRMPLTFPALTPSTATSLKFTKQTFLIMMFCWAASHANRFQLRVFQRKTHLVEHTASQMKHKGHYFLMWHESFQKNARRLSCLRTLKTCNLTTRDERSRSSSKHCRKIWDTTYFSK